MLENIGRIISIPFLLLTYYQYYYSTDFEYLYKKLFMDYILSLIFTNICVLMCEVNSSYNEPLPQTILFIMFMFVLTSSLLWTNVLTYNFWWHIKDLLPCDDQSTNKNTYIKCCIYVLLGSLFQTVFVILIEYDLSPFFSPTFGFILEKTWFIFPVLVLLSNFLMMAHCTIIIVKEVITVKSLTEQNVIIKKKYKKMFIMCFKLIIVTIFSLLFSLYFSAALESIFDIEVLSDREYLLFIPASFQGLFIFLMFSLKKRNIVLFKKWVFEIFNHKNINKENSRTNVIVNDSTEIAKLSNISEQVDK